MASKKLEELYEAMLSEHPSTLNNWGGWRDDLPVWGGDRPRPKDLYSVWSWDETHMIVGYCAVDLRIVPRPDDPADDGEEE